MLACRYLMRHGYEILARNYHSAYGELDILARQEDILAVVEVKTRFEQTRYEAAAAVTPAKQEKIRKTLQLYLLDHPCDLQPRFDVCEIYFTQDGKKYLRYLAGAFE